MNRREILQMRLGRYGMDELVLAELSNEELEAAANAAGILPLDRAPTVNGQVVEPRRPASNLRMFPCPMCEYIKANGGFGPDHDGSKLCKSGSLASGGKNSHCTCSACF